MRADALAYGHGLQAAAVGLALLEAATSGAAHARTRPVAAPIEGVRLVESTPAIPGDAYAAGRARLGMGDIPAALAAFRQALLADPQSLDALNGIAIAYDRMGRHDLARAFYDSALAIDPHAAPVLNNLGYSLYLQGQFTDAIPILQAASADIDTGANARRLLALIADRLRTDAIAAARAELAAELSAENAAPARHPAVAAVTPPPMRIEVSSSGEQRLVIGGPAPARALTASLGDSARDTLVARPWDAGDERRLAARVEAERRAETAAAERAAAANDDEVAELLAAEAAAHTTADATPPKAGVAARARAPARPVHPPAAPAALVLAARPPVRPGASTTPDRLLPAASDAGGDRLLPGASLASRTTARPVPSRPRIGEDPPRGLPARFESDDETLNIFAAAVRSKPIRFAARTPPPEPVRPPAAPVTTAEAIRRLEALIVWARAA